MPEKFFSKKELKITAAIYASRKGVVEYVRVNGKLPDTIDNGGAQVAMRVIMEQRGIDITLTPDEQLVFDAILREKRLPGGAVHLVDPEE